MPNGAAASLLLRFRGLAPVSTHYTLHKWLVGRLDGWIDGGEIPFPDPSANKATSPSSAHDNFHGLAIWAADAATISIRRRARGGGRKAACVPAGPAIGWNLEDRLAARAIQPRHPESAPFS